MSKVPPALSDPLGGVEVTAKKQNNKKIFQRDVNWDTVAGKAKILLDGVRKQSPKKSSLLLLFRRSVYTPHE